MKYSEIRPQIKIGDVIGCRSNSMFGRLIRKFKGGEHDFSHVAMIIRDTDRVEVLEALTKGGMQRNYLSKIYEASHGKLFWLKMECSDDEKDCILLLASEILARKVKYDFFSTYFAIFQPIFVDVKKFNCSEFAWFMLTRAGRLLKRLKGNREIAPVPGDLPTWAGVEPTEIDMSA